MQKQNQNGDGIKTFQERYDVTSELNNLVSYQQPGSHM